MAKVTFIGDVHGMFEKYQRLLLRFMEPTVQIGDMGVGFPTKMGESQVPALDPKDQWFDGNHDKLSVCKEHPNYLGRFGMHPLGFFWSGGAFSVDAFYRRAGIDWWPSEQMSRPEMEEALQLYADEKPDLVVSHDCPRLCYDHMMKMIGKEQGPYYENSNAFYLDSLFKTRKPKLWLFGHWHVHANFEIDGTKFVCIPELGHFTTEI
jgi:hypothetical protein